MPVRVRLMNGAVTLKWLFSSIELILNNGL